MSLWINPNYAEWRRGWELHRMPILPPLAKKKGKRVMGTADGGDPQPAPEKSDSTVRPKKPKLDGKGTTEEYQKQWSLVKEQQRKEEGEWADMVLGPHDPLDDLPVLPDNPHVTGRRPLSNKGYVTDD